MIKKLFIAATLMTAGLATSAQETTEFKPSGKFNGKVFMNFNHDFSEDAQRKDAFEIQRAYLGYGYQMSEAVSAKILFDASSSSSASEYTAFLKIAQLDWKINPKALLSMGMIGLKQYDTQEKWFGYRYVTKDVQDIYKFGTSADAGINLAYSFNSKITANVFAINGEGFKLSQDNDGRVKFGTSIVAEPIDGLTLKGYYSYYGGKVENSAKELRDTVAIQNYDLFAGYRLERFRVGAGICFMDNGSTFSNVAEGNKMMAWNVLGAFSLNSKIEFFAQLMDYKSNKLDGAINSWNYKNDGNIAILGVEYAPLKGLNTSLNVRNHTHDNSAIIDYTAAFLNVEVTF